MKTLPNNKSLTIFTKNKHVLDESGCIKYIVNMFAERTALLVYYGYFMNPEQYMGLIKVFGELANEAHQVLVPLPLFSGQQVTRQGMQQDSRQGILKNPPRPILQQTPSQDLQQDLKRVQSSPDSERPYLGPLGQKALNNVLYKSHCERIRALKMRERNLGIICNKNIQLHRQQSALNKVHVAFLTISTDRRKPDG
ncbi:hypothetical protein BDC45DRAFT_533791 [Circinella umbellata]|nr:hypothetical protein BDC45DRAFT_533791 [Circinella umbellata]